ncbi:hypothetical protein L596_023122 [Steinernema carpocapsae]|uniref:Uncharacterized protein n=1 Tax=Steinernema carpocapsae TaxID=34508 RepID=A0A4V5ZZB0_STECR|nr:hypothetical protein L596_023122 [Steinernema carpocapsae]
MNSFDLYKLMVDDAFHHLQIHAEDVDLLTEDEGIYDAVLFRMLSLTTKTFTNLMSTTSSNPSINPSTGLFS